jgi:hypothetical protein
MLHKWNLTPLTDDAVIVVTELASNAVKATLEVHHAAPVILRLRSNFTTLLIELRDSVMSWPWPRDTEPADAEGGRGLALVSLCSDVWGYYPDGSGKVVWALL